MRIKGAVFMFAVAGAAVLGVAPGASAEVAGGAAGQRCWSVPAAVQESASGLGLWSYTHTVSWCGEQNSITSVAPPAIMQSTRDDTCVWEGIKNQRTESGPAKWTSFSMGEFACTGGNGVAHVNPWVIVTGYPDGTSQVESGTAASVPLS